MIKQFDKAACRLVRNAALEALQAVAKQHGLTVEPEGGGRFGDLDFTHKITWKVGDKKAVADQNREQWNELCAAYGLKPSHFGKEITARGSLWRVSGIRPRKRRYPIVCENAHGQRLLITPDYVRAGR